MELGTHHVQDRYDKMGVENICIYRYVSMYLCIFYIEYSFHTDIHLFLSTQRCAATPMFASIPPRFEHFVTEVNYGVGPQTLANQRKVYIEQVVMTSV